MKVANGKEEVDMAQKEKKTTAQKGKNIVEFLIGIAVVILVNYIGQFAFTRLDLTAEKRFSLNEATIKQLQEIEETIYLKVYLEGELPAGYQRLSDATKEILDEFKVYAGANLEYEFINPSAATSRKEREEFYTKLSKSGLKYANIRSQEADKNSEQIIFPGAIMTYNEKEAPVQLLKSQIGADEEIMLNNSIQQLEYQLSSTLQRLTRSRAKNVAFIEGHGELNEYEVADISTALKEFYNVERVKIDGQLDAIKFMDAIVIAGPDSSFSEKDKYVIDQFVMNGKSVLWLVEPVDVSMDSIRQNGITLALPRKLNIEDQLFRYGCRVNPDFVQDLQSRVIPVVTGMVGNQPKQEFFPWYYYPMIMSKSNHPIVNNVDALRTSFMSSIDMVGDKSITKTPILQTSQYTKLAKAPHRISLNVLRDPPNQNQFRKSNTTVGLLLEGKFQSVFKNRISPKVSQNKEFKYKEESILPGKMIVLSDADLIKNGYNPSTQEYYALGYDKYTRRMFGNKEFIMNCINYMLDDDGLINSRNKEFKLRLLDKQRILKERKNWQIFNTTIPVILVLLFGFIHYTIRKRLYAK